MYVYAIWCDLYEIELNCCVILNCVNLYGIQSNYLQARTLPTWSAHQYQTDTNVDLIKIPGHGRSELIGSRKMWNASERGSPHVFFVTLNMLEVMLYSTLLLVEFANRMSLGSACEGMASKYFTISPWIPPTFTKAIRMEIIKMIYKPWYYPEIKNSAETHPKPTT